MSVFNRLTMQTMMYYALVTFAFVQISLDPTYPPCPLYENTTIIEQPVDFTTLDDKYVNAATSFIKRESGKPFTYMAKYYDSSNNC